MKTRQRPVAILFDMDGTLLNETESPDQSWQKLCFEEAPRHHLAPEILLQAIRESYATYKEAIKDDAKKQRRDRLDPFGVRVEMIKEALARVGKKDAQLAPVFVHRYDAEREAHRQWMPHALETLQRLQAIGTHLALLTNGNASYQRRKIQHYDLAPLFELVLIEEEFGSAKSDTRIYEYTLDYFHLTAQQTWMVGDDLIMDVATPQQLGIPTIWFDPHRQGLPKDNFIHPDYIIHTLPELLELSDTFHAIERLEQRRKNIKRMV